MFCYLFYKKSVFLLLLLLLFCALCKNVSALNIDLLQSSPTSTVNRVELFKPEDINNVVKPDGSSGEEQNKINIKNVTSPFLFAADGLMFAFAEVNNTDKSETKIDLMAKYISTTEGEWGDNDITANNWKLQLITENVKDIKFGFAAKGAAVKDNKKKIYLLAVNNTSPASESDSSGNNNLRLLLIAGDISGSTPNEKKITWEVKKLVSSKVVDELKKTVLNDPEKTTLSAGGLAFVTKNKRIVFVLQVKQKDDDTKKVTALVQLEEETSSEHKLGVLYNETFGNCRPYFFQWNDKIMMILNNCNKDEGFSLVKEFDFNTNKWEESKESISRLESFLNDKRDFTTARIGKNNKSVLLFTQQKPKSGGGKNKKDVHLWVTDGDHLSDVGTVATNIDGGGDYYGSILHTNNELFILQRKYDSNSGAAEEDKYELTRLKEQLKKMNDLLDVWKKADELVLKLCGEKDKASAMALCAAQLSTDGVVGFLSNETNTNNNNVEWMDEYKYINATMTNGNKVDNGFKFSGAGAGAKWQLGKTKEEDQPYNFAKYGFTLVATVTIGENKRQKGNSVLGVALSDDKNNNLVGLWCTTGGKWGVSGDDSQATPTQNQSCEQGKTYMVTLTLNNDGKGAVYVDGEQLSGNGRDFTVNTNSGNIAYFYFGTKEANNDESHVTVTNVLLYNRPLEEEEIKKLRIINEEKQEGEEDIIKNSQNTDNMDKRREDKKSTEGSDGGDENEGTPENTNNNNDNDEREGTSTLQSESSTVRGGVVGLLTVLLLLFLLDVSVSDV